MIENTFNSLVTDLQMKFGIGGAGDALTGLFDGERPVEDIEGNYTLANGHSYNLKFLDTKFLVDGIEYFRPFIRGFLVLLMLLYHVRQLIGFFGHDSGVVAGKTDYENVARHIQRM